MAFGHAAERQERERQQRLDASAAAQRQSKANQRAELSARFGDAPETLEKIDAVIALKADIRATNRGTPETKTARGRLRLKLTERLDALMADLEKRPATTPKATALEARYPTVALDVLINAAKVTLSHLESLAPSDALKYEQLQERIDGPEWFEDVIELLEQHASSWLSDYDTRIAARLDVEIKADVERELAELGEAAFLARYGEQQ